MAFKTMLRQLISKWGVMSIDLQSAFEADSVAEDTDYMQAGQIDHPEATASQEPPIDAEVVSETTEDVSLNDI